VLYAAGVEFSEREPSSIETPPPTQERFDQLVNDFWYQLLWSAKKLWRGEVLVAKQACDGLLTGLLVELARWRSDESHTWHGSRFFERWAGDDLVERSSSLSPATTQRTSRARSARRPGCSDGSRTRSPRAHGLVVPEDRAEVLRRLEALLA
jgi:hypothetical protein